MVFESLTHEHRRTFWKCFYDGGLDVNHGNGRQKYPLYAS